MKYLYWEKELKECYVCKKKKLTIAKEKDGYICKECLDNRKAGLHM
jgi:hypothetical protein